MTADRPRPRRAGTLLIGAVLVVAGGFMGALVMRSEAQTWIEDAMVGVTESISESVLEATADLPRLVASIDSFRSEHHQLRENVDSLQAVLSRHMGDREPDR